MASEIKVDTIVNAGGDNDTGIDLATNDQILLKVANATKLTMNSTGQTTIVGEGGSTTTNLQQGLAKVWCAVNQSSSQAIRDSFNTASISDEGTGVTRYTYTSAMSNSGYSTTQGHSNDNNFSSLDMASSPSTTTVQLRVNQHDGSAEDAAYANIATHGDLA